MWSTSESQYCVPDFTAHWKRTAGRPTPFGTLGHWTPFDLLKAVRDRSDLERRDVLAAELVRLAKAGHAPADQLLLMAMLPRVVHLTRTCRGLQRIPLRDAQAVALGAMWEAIRVHPDRPITAVLHRLGLDALNIITKTHSRFVDHREISTDPETLAEICGAEEPAADTVDDLATLLKWGVDSNIVTREDVRVIAVVDLGTIDDRELLAQELAVAPASLVRRAHRIRTKLQVGVAAEIDRVGSW